MAGAIDTSEITSLALNMCELSAPAGLSEPTPQMQDAAKYFQMAIDTALASYDWSWARRSVVLSVVADLPAGVVSDPDLPFLVELPGDFLSIRAVDPDRLSWRREGRYLRVDSADNVRLTYTRKITDEGEFPAEFKPYAATCLAQLLAPYWVRTVSKRRELAAEMQSAMEMAKMVDRESISAQTYRHDGQPVDWMDVIGGSRIGVRCY